MAFGVLKLIAAFAALALVLRRILRNLWLRQKYDLHRIPGPPGYPLLGNLPQVLTWDKPQIHLKVLEWVKAYGKVIKINLPPAGYTVYITDPACIQANITGHGIHGMSKPSRYGLFQKLFGPHDRDGIFTSLHQTDHWKAVRKEAAKAFSSKGLSAAFPKVLGKARQLAEVIRSSPPGEAADFQPLLARFTLDAIGVAGFDIDFGALKTGGCPLLESILYCTDDVFASAFNPGRRLSRWLFPSGKLARECKQMYGQLYGEYDWILRELRGRGEPVADDLDLWACLMRAKDPRTGAPLGDEAVLPEVATFVLGGTDTTAHQIMWALFAIATHPDVQANIVQELKDSGVFRIVRREGRGDLSRSDVDGLTYLGMVIKEAMRMFPVGQGTTRCAPESRELCGYRLPPGTAVRVSFVNLGLSPWLWDDPGRFDPERWRAQAAGGVGAARGGRGGARCFWGFSDGPRDCVGQRLAMMEMRLALAVVLANFEIRASEEMGSFDKIFSRQYLGLVLSINGGMWLHCDPRNADD